MPLDDMIRVLNSCFSRMLSFFFFFRYQGEIGFFDFYIIPLAKKLQECGVFGVSCDEYLNYAIHNREEWEIRGKEIVQQYAEQVQATTTSSLSQRQELIVGQQEDSDMEL